MIDGLMLVAVVAVVGRLLLLLVLAGSRGRVASPDGEAPLVDVVIPAFDEAETLEHTVRAAIGPGVGRVVVVDDGSTDATGAIARRLAAELDPVVYVAHPTNQGKAAALQTGLALASGPLVATLDADTRPDADAIARLARACSQPGVAAAACNVTVASPDRLVRRWQDLEYVTAIHLGRRAQARVGALATVPGALAVWRVEAVEACGGFSGRTLAEDTDLTLSLQRRGWQVRFVDDARAYTEAPSTWRALFAQRRRWLLGNLQCAVLHVGAFRESSSRLRWLALPDLWWTHLGVYGMAPLSALWLTQTTWTWGAVVALSATLLGLDLLGSVMALWIDRGRYRALLDAPLQRIGFPFFMLAVFASLVVGRLLTLRQPYRVSWRAS